ncbi:MAG: hypothetical protein ACPHYA_08470, partial [Pseudomonadales bacterium]
MKRLGLVGWRGMVGSVLMQRMQEENDFQHIEPVFFTTSQAGQAAPDFGVDVPDRGDDLVKARAGRGHEDPKLGASAPAHWVVKEILG